MRRLIALLLLSATPALSDVPAVVGTTLPQGYEGFAQAARALADVPGCDPAILRPAWNAAFDAWLAVGFFHLGPVEEDGRALAIAFWPDPKGLGAKAQRGLLAGDPAKLAPAAFADQSVAARGLSGLERLLYPAEPFAQDACPLIHATAQDLARMAAEVQAEWPGYAAQLLTAGQTGNTSFLTEAEARQALLTQLDSGLEFLADTRLGRPLGSFDRPRPEWAESRASGRGLRNVQVSLAALKGYAVALGGDLPQTTAAFDRAIGLAEALDDPTLAGVADPQGRLKVEILQQAVQAIRTALLAEMAPALGVGVGFNSQDGD